VTRRESSASRETAPAGQLVGDATRDLSALVRDEVELAKADLRQSVRSAGLGGGLFGAAGVIALFGFGALVATAILALALVLDAWLAGLVVAGVLMVAAVAAALLGKKEVAEAAPALPATGDGVKQDVQAAKGHRP
jgi:hypothetical protein